MRPAHAAAALVTSLAALTVAPAAWADPPPKVCVVVAGDPDDNARGSAERLADAVGSRADLRGVADADTRAVLRGESRADASFAPLAAARRRLAGTDADATALDAVGEPLGCALVVEVASRPTAVMLRAYDVVHHAFRGTMQVGVVDASLVDRFVLDHAVAALAPAPATPASAPAPAPAPPSTSASTSNPALAPAPAASAPIAPAPAAPRAAALARPPAARDPRATLPARPADRQPGVLPWVIAGGAALALVGVFFLAGQAGPGATVLTVTHPPGGAP